jgi:hypothetical protein
VEGDDIGLLEQGRQRNPLRARLTGPFIRQGFSRSENPSPEGLCDPRNLSSNSPQPDHADGFPFQGVSGDCRPALLAHSPIDLRNMSQQREDQPPGQLDGGNPGIVGSNGDSDATAGRRRKIEMGNGLAGLRYQLQRRGQRQLFVAKFASLPHEEDCVCLLQGPAQFFAGTEPLPHHGDVGARLEFSERGDLSGHPLIVIQHYYLKPFCFSLCHV